MKYLLAFMINGIPDCRRRRGSASSDRRTVLHFRLETVYAGLRFADAQDTWLVESEGRASDLVADLMSVFEPHDGVFVAAEAAADWAEGGELGPPVSGILMRRVHGEDFFERLHASIGGLPNGAGEEEATEALRAVFGEAVPNHGLAACAIAHAAKKRRERLGLS